MRIFLSWATMWLLATAANLVRTQEYPWSEEMVETESNHGNGEKDKEILYCACTSAQLVFQTYALPCNDYWQNHKEKKYAENVFLILAPHGIRGQNDATRYNKLMDEECTRAQELSRSTVECFSQKIEANGSLPVEEFRRNWLNSNLEENNRILREIGVQGLEGDAPFTNVPSKMGKAHSVVDQLFVNCMFNN